MTPAAAGTQISFAELGTPLRDVTFVVVDLETTGGAPVDAGITEIGAVKVRAGEVVGQFQTLVNPGVPIPPFVAALTGITDAVVASAPTLASVLPTFLEFARDAVLVAHNAPYDVGFLKGACAIHGQRWHDPAVVDTARLARVALHRDEVPNCKLATLAAHFRTTVSPTHRAFDDARATADVLHRLLERAGDLGVTTLEDVQAFASRVSHAQRTKRHLADGLPDAPGVYVFQDAQGVALYVGTSRSIRSRVRTYFTASEQRRRMAEMVRIAERVVPIVCATALEARVRELRLIAEHQPRYNQRSRRPDAQTWLKLTDEPAPRLAVVRAGPGRPCRWRPVPRPVHLTRGGGGGRPRHCCSRSRCAPARRGWRVDHVARCPACALAELGRCLAPCTSPATARRTAPSSSRSGRPCPATSDRSRPPSRTAWGGSPSRSGTRRPRCGASGSRRSRPPASAPTGWPCFPPHRQVVAARPTPDLGWEIHVMRHGRLAGAAVAPPGTTPGRSWRPWSPLPSTSTRPCRPRRPASMRRPSTCSPGWAPTGSASCAAPSGLAMPPHCGGDLARRLTDARRAGTVRAMGADYRAVADAARPRGPVDARPVSRILSA